MALAVLSRARTALVVSVRVPMAGRSAPTNSVAAFRPAAGARAGGINHLPETEFDAFAERFEAAFRLD